MKKLGIVVLLLVGSLLLAQSTFTENASKINIWDTNLTVSDPLFLVGNVLGFNLKANIYPTGTWDFRDAIIRIPSTPVLPLTCDVGEIHLAYEKSLPGKRLFVCETINDWVSY